MYQTASNKAKSQILLWKIQFAWQRLILHLRNAISATLHTRENASLPM
jgi:hypothetical protein